MLNKLNDILLSDDVVLEFNKSYSDINFYDWINIVLPEIEDCRKLKQDNPWHIYNCLEHILNSVQNMNRLTADLDLKSRKMLAYTMFLHDIGKPQCHIRRYSKLYNRYVDSFFDHNHASVKIADRVLPSFGFSSTDIVQIKALIEDHDIFMSLTLKEDGNKFHRVLSEEVIIEEVSKLNKVGNGKQLLEFLIKVGKADNLAQNPQMTKSSLKLLDVMEDMLIMEK